MVKTKQNKTKAGSIHRDRDLSNSIDVIFDTYHNKCNSVLNDDDHPDPRGHFPGPCAKCSNGFSIYCSRQASYRESPGFPCSLEAFFSLSCCLPLKALLLGNHELFQSLKFKVHFMESPFWKYLSDNRGC